MTATNWAGCQNVWVPSVPIAIGESQPSTGDALMDADGEEVHLVGHIVWADRGSHTISSAGGKIHWLPGTAISFVAVASLQIGIQDVDLANGPAARGDGTFDTSATLVAGVNTITTTTALQTPMGAGSKTLAHGDVCVVAFKLSVTSGTQSVNVRGVGTSAGAMLPTCTLITSGPTYTNQSRLPNIVFQADDGTLGTFYGTLPFSNLNVQTYKNNDTTKEYGNVFQFNTPVQIDGFYVSVNTTTSAANFSLVLYSDPLAAGAGPTAAITVAVDANTVGIANAGKFLWVPIPTLTTLAANTNYCVALLPTAAVNVSISYVDEVTGDMAVMPLGTACYGVSRNTVAAGTAFGSISSGTRRFFIGVSVCGGDDGAGGAGGIKYHPGMNGGANG